MRKFCQNLQNAQLCRPKTGILSAFLPSAAGQNSDTFPVLHTVERGVSLQGRENFRGYPFRHRCAMPPSPRGRLNSLSQNLTVLPAPSGREALRGNFLLAASVQGRSAGPEAGRGVLTPPSLPLDSTHPATGQGLLALDNPKEEVEAQKS